MGTAKFSQYTSCKNQFKNSIKGIVQKETLIEQIKGKDPFKDKFGKVGDDQDGNPDLCVKLKIKGSGVL